MEIGKLGAKSCCAPMPPNLQLTKDLSCNYIFYISIKNNIIIKSLTKTRKKKILSNGKKKKCIEHEMAIMIKSILY